jgi:hypothetical protein
MVRRAESWLLRGFRELRRWQRLRSQGGGDAVAQPASPADPVQLFAAASAAESTVAPPAGDLGPSLAATPPVQAFRFVDPRQRRLYELLLRLIGPGAATYYRDACRLMVLEPPFDTNTHLIMHLMRELESSLRDVLVALAERAAPDPGELKKQKAAAAKQQTTHEWEIQLVAQYLGMAEDGPAVEAWLGRAGKSNPDALHRHAHRVSLGLPRPADDAFWAYCRETEDLFIAILSAFEPSYTAAIAGVDELIAKSSPTASDAKRLAQYIPNTPVILGHFFDHLQSPAWLPLLREQRFFDRAPDAQRDVDTGEIVGYPEWAASRYLVRMAQDHPDAQEIVLEIVRGLMDTTNPHVQSDIIAILIALPADAAADLIPQMTTWAARKESE